MGNEAYHSKHTGKDIDDGILMIKNHEGRITQNETQIKNHEERIATNEEDIKEIKENSPTIEKGTGKDSIVIMEGEAIGDYSVAGGTTDSSIIESVVGSDLVASLVDIENAKALGTMSIAFGLDSESRAAGTAAIGVANTAGIQGYYWHTIDFANKTITLSTSRPTLLSNSVKAPSSLDWAVGDYISIVNDNNYSFCTQITAISGNTISVDNLPFAENTYDTNSILGRIFPATYSTPMDRTISAIYKEEYISVLNKTITRWMPRSGTVELGLGAFTIGGLNTSTGMFAVANGRGNLAAGNSSDVSGTNNIAAGDNSDVSGMSNIATGDASSARGKTTEASGECAVTEGLETKATGRFSHAQNENAEALAQASHAGGLRSIVKATANNGFAHGRDAIVSDGARQAAVFGNGTIVSTPNGLVTGAYNIEDTEKKYLRIIGNGTSDTNRSNAYTLDENGNGWFAGNITVGSDNKQLVTTNDIDSKLSGLPIVSGKGKDSAQSKTNVASGYKSFAIGIGTKAAGRFSHAQNENTEALAQGSHAGGLRSIVKAEQGFAHGRDVVVKEDALRGVGFGNSTIVTKPNSIVTGAYNIEDNADMYLHIVGNGSSFNGRSNAYTLDNAGNGWFAGNVTVGADKKELATNDKITALPIRSGTGAKSAVVAAAYNSQDAAGANAVLLGLASDASGQAACASGNCTKATGRFSHAQNENAEAHGQSSHAGGLRALVYSHTGFAHGRDVVVKESATQGTGFGNGTIVTNANSIVTGAYNIEDTENKYLHIVGNGSSENDRRNAYTLDHEGNAWFAGSITVGSDNKELATKEYVDKWFESNSVINNLTSDSVTDALSANQGKVLNDKIAELVALVESLTERINALESNL